MKNHLRIIAKRKRKLIALDTKDKKTFLKNKLTELQKQVIQYETNKRTTARNCRPTGPKT